MRTKLFPQALACSSDLVTYEITYSVTSQHVGKNENIASDVVFSRIHDIQVLLISLYFRDL